MNVTIDQLKRHAIFMVVPGQPWNAWPAILDGLELIRSKDGFQRRPALKFLSELA
jgi:hypothetical protein